MKAQSTQTFESTADPGFIAAREAYFEKRERSKHEFGLSDELKLKLAKLQESLEKGGK